MSTNLFSVTTPKANVELTQEGHVRIYVHENSDVNLNDIKQINEAKKKIVGHGKHTVLFLVPAIGNLSNSAREFSASQEANHNAIAKALVVKNLAGRLICRFFINVNKPPSPTKIFKCEREASSWLNKMRLVS